MTGRVLAAGTWAEGPGYPRARALCAALRGQGVEVAEVRDDALGAGPALRTAAARPWRWPSLACRGRKARAGLERRFREAVERLAPDAVLVPYPGHLAAPWIRSWFEGAVVLDLFLSAYLTAVDDRELFAPRSLPARILAAVDRRACRAADLVLMDTPQHADCLRQTLGLGAERLSWVPVADPDEPREPPPLTELAGPLRLLFFGTGVPLHGLECLVGAVARCDGVELTLIGGDAAERARARTAFQDRLVLGSRFVPPAELHRHLARCHLVAGIFGTSRKAAAVVPFKVMHALAHGRPVITRDGPAVRELLRPGEDCLTVPAGDAAVLAARLGAIAADRARLPAMAAAARATYDETFSLAATGRRLCGLLTRLCGRRFGPSREPLPAAGQRSTCG